MIRAGGIRGTRRLARHLWRMCFGLFIASGSFVAQLVMMKFMPAWMHSVPVIVVRAAIRFSTLHAICEALACQPGDLLAFDPTVPVPPEES